MTITLQTIDPEGVLLSLTTEEKIQLLSGSDMWHTTAVPRLDIPRVRMSDGPNGVRGISWIQGTTSSCFPCATGLGASFDKNLVERVGMALGAECRSRGVHCLLGPTVNIQRDPRGGRGFESYSEDPFLSGTVAAAWIQGLQSCGVMACPKHWLGNEQEFHRHSNNSVIDERTLHEIYVEPFRLLSRARPASYMTSYNRVNGTHVCEDPKLLRDVLRDQLGFDGMLISDWGGTYSSADGILASLDIDMPGPTTMRGPCVERDVVSGKLTYEDVDDCVLRILNFVRKAQESGIPFEAPEKPIDTPAVRALLREAANAGVVLLKNDDSILPLSLKFGTRIAVIGPNANTASYAGGGSASLPASYTVTPLEAITAIADEAGASVSYTIGADCTRWTPLLDQFLRAPDGTPGVECSFFQEDPWQNPTAKPLFSFVNTSTYCFFGDGIPAHIPVRGYVSLRTTLVPDASGTWELGLGVAGQADLYVDGAKVLDNSTDQVADVLFFNTGTEERTVCLPFTAGQEYNLEVRFSNLKPISAMSPYCGRRGGIRLGGRAKHDPEEEIARAVKMSLASDVTILVIGTNGEWEAESYDRDNIKLPGYTDPLVRAVLTANPLAVIVNQSGMPVEFPWVDQAGALVQAFLGGNECGSAIADVIFGKTNPSGKLPISWPVKLQDYPAPEDFGHRKTTVYREGIHVGYRHFDHGGPASAFPFGYGLSYTAFEVSDLTVVPTETFGAKVSVRVTNTGTRSGSEVVQVYVRCKAPSVDRPAVELKGYTKVTVTPGHTEAVDVHLIHEAWAYYSVEAQAWVGEAGEYEVCIGTSARDIVLVNPFYLEQSFSYVGIGPPTVL